MATLSHPAVVVMPDAGPLITLAYADALDLLLKPGWPVQIVDMVLHEVTRNATPTSEKIGQWVERQSAPVVATRAYSHYRAIQAEGQTPPSKSNLGEIAIQEAMHELALTSPAITGVFLFEDHKIARASFQLPANCRKISTRAWLLFLEGKGWIASAAEVERAAIAQGRNFSRLRFPP
jgi:hypothetical protein